MRKWFENPSNRVKLYQSARAVAPVLVIFGVTSEGTIQGVLNILGAVVLFGTNQVAIKNVKQPVLDTSS